MDLYSSSVVLKGNNVILIQCRGTGTLCLRFELFFILDFFISLRRVGSEASNGDFLCYPSFQKLITDYMKPDHDDTKTYKNCCSYRTWD